MSRETTVSGWVGGFFHVRTSSDAKTGGGPVTSAVGHDQTLALLLHSEPSSDVPDRTDYSIT